MKTLTTVAQIKSAAAKDNDATFFVELNKPVVDWLMSIGGKNRALSWINVEMFCQRLEKKTWRPNSCEMKINASCDWLIDGHHRVAAVALAHAYGALAKLSVVPDKISEAVFCDQDCVGVRRNVGCIAALDGLSNASFWCSISSAYRFYVHGDVTKESVESVKQFASAHKWVADENIICSGFRGGKRLRANIAAAFIFAIDSKPEEAENIKAFFASVRSGEMLAKGMPAYALRNAILVKQFSGKAEFLAVLKAIQFHLNNCACYSLRFSASDYDKVAKDWGCVTKTSLSAPKNRPCVKNAVQAMNKAAK